MREVFQRFMDKLVRQLKDDGRFCGLAVGGSWDSEDFDEFSDLDLVVVSKDADYESSFSDRFIITKNLGSQVTAFSGEHVGHPEIVICLYKEPLIHVDLKFIPLKEFGKRDKNPIIAWEIDHSLSNVLSRSAPQLLKTDSQWIEDRFWTWIHCCATRIKRGELFEAISFLSFLRDTVLGPMSLVAQGRPPIGVRRLEFHATDFSKKLQRTIPAYNRESCLKALKATVQLYKELRQRYSANEILINEDAELEALNYLAKP